MLAVTFVSVTQILMSLMACLESKWAQERKSEMILCGSLTAAYSVRSYYSTYFVLYVCFSSFQPRRNPPKIVFSTSRKVFL
jgi:hypothetical protein